MRYGRGLRLPRSKCLRDQSPLPPQPHTLAACGHPSIVHGGAIASVLDDTFGVLFFASRLGNGFTANLNVNYRKPLAAGTDVTVHVAVDRVEGRKVRDGET